VTKAKTVNVKARKKKISIYFQIIAREKVFACLEPVDDGEVGVVLLLEVVHLVVQLRDLDLQLGDDAVLLHPLPATIELMFLAISIFARWLPLHDWYTANCRECTPIFLIRVKFMNMATCNFTAGVNDAGDKKLTELELASPF